MPISSNSSLLGVNAICKNLDKVIAEGRLAYPYLNEENLMNTLGDEQFAEARRITLQNQAIEACHIAHPKLNEEDLMNMLDGEQFAESKWQARKLTVIE
jgi:hypothetical protein